MLIKIEGDGLDITHKIVEDLESFGLTPIAAKKIINRDNSPNTLIFNCESGVEEFPLVESDSDIGQLIEYIKEIPEKSIARISLLGDNAIDRIPQVRLFKEEDNVMLAAVLHEGAVLRGAPINEGKKDENEEDANDNSEPVLKVNAGLSLLIINKGDQPFAVKRLNSAILGFYLEDIRGVTLAHLMAEESEDPVEITVKPGDIYEDAISFHINVPVGVYNLLPETSWLIPITGDGPDKSNKERTQYLFPPITIKVIDNVS